MSGLVLPSGAPARMVEQPPKGLSLEDDLTDEQRAAIEENAAKVDPEEFLPKVTAAFAVIIDRDGGVSIDPAMVSGVAVDREANNADIVGALAVMQNEIATNMSAMKTAQIMTQQAQAMQAHMAEQARVADIQRRLKPQGGRG